TGSYRRCSRLGEQPTAVDKEIQSEPLPTVMFVLLLLINGMNDLENHFVLLPLINGMKDLENQPTHGRGVLAFRCICTHCLNTHFEKLKNSEQKSWGYIGTFYVHAQSFGEKPCIFVARVKKIKKCKMNSCNEASEIVFFTQATKNLVFHRKVCACT
uniref:Uncharacterized protein n=5 Tax=Aegilops tauschii subsp. strangulata TaxID=200361 RepID=A0A453NH88_AEGTS